MTDETAPVGVTALPLWSTSWNEPLMTEPLDDVANCGPVSLTVPTKVFAGIGLVPPGPVVSTRVGHLPAGVVGERSALSRM